MRDAHFGRKIQTQLILHFMALIAVNGCFKGSQFSYVAGNKISHAVWVRRMALLHTLSIRAELVYSRQKRPVITSLQVCSDAL